MCDGYTLVNAVYQRGAEEVKRCRTTSVVRGYFPVLDLVIYFTKNKPFG